ncbi:phenylacetate--CoA ligase family protein [Aeoliella mucimassa]|uniref:Phenylacetate-coenzyme A ligase n=1 Tax=Aeoliella mucimassa TaxID=2527972 RepID=A0A518ALS2_9BACT|nr:phenylacetate--CoA ligase family protein [Aeoliella mucimassa]QDU55679.1 Phenylacetate-coenzyme A ligase [Aeoliella mucimassa]
MHSLKPTLLNTLLRATGEGERITFQQQCERSQWWNPEQLSALQLTRLRALLQHAYQNCEYYRDTINKADFDVTSIDSVDDLRALPQLTKSIIQQNTTSLVASNWPESDTIQNFTGGSTGQPLRLYYNKSRHESRVAITMRHDGWAGRFIGGRVAYFWGAPRDAPSQKLQSRVRRWLEGSTLWLDTGNIYPQQFTIFNEQLIRFRPTVIVAYANSLSLFANYLLEKGLTTCHPKSIITSAEILTDESRQVIEKVFGCPIFNRYGCREVSVIASECEEHEGLHISAEGLHIEIVDQHDQPVKQGESGDILVTDLLNYAMPLIRYRIGDLGSWMHGPCKCGRGLPRLKSVDGRVTDFIVGSDNQLVSGVFLATYVVAQRPSLGRVQIVQSRAGHVELLVCPSDAFDATSDISYLQQSMARHVGPIDIEVTLVDEIEPEPSGKLLFCKSTISRSATSPLLAGSPR